MKAPFFPSFTRKVFLGGGLRLTVRPGARATCSRCSAQAGGGAAGPRAAHDLRDGRGAVPRQLEAAGRGVPESGWAGTIRRWRW